MMVRVLELMFEGCRFESRHRVLSASNGSVTISFSWFPVVFLSQSHRVRNLSELLQGPASWIGSSTSMCEKKIGA